MGFRRMLQLSNEQLMEVLEWSSPVMREIDMDLLKQRGTLKTGLTLFHMQRNASLRQCEFLSSMRVDSNFVCLSSGIRECISRRADEPLPRAHRSGESS